ncbi:MAG: hypothetical protein WD077_12705 [Bacteroidia bacterium]
MNQNKIYYKRALRSKLKWFIPISLALLTLLYFLSIWITSLENQHWTNLYLLLSTIAVNIVAAGLWYSLLNSALSFQSNAPIFKAMPFLRDRSSKVHILLASLPSNTNHLVTGMGEARALSMLLETLKVIEFPMENVLINYDDHYSRDEIKALIENENVLMLGGPNHNSATAFFMEDNFNKLSYVFETATPNANGGEQASFTSNIVTNTQRPQVVTGSEPGNVESDIDLTKDCGMIIRKEGAFDNFAYVLAGGMSPGVWLATCVLTSYDVFLSNGQLSQQIVFESKIENVFSAKLDRVKIVKNQELIK